MRLRGRQSRTTWASLSVLVIATSVLVGCNSSKGEKPAASSEMVVVDERETAGVQLSSPTPGLDAGDYSKRQSATQESLDADSASEPTRTATPTPTSEPTRAATPTPTAVLMPRGSNAPENEFADEDDVSREPTSAVLKYPDIPAHVNGLILEYMNMSPVTDAAGDDSFPRVLAIICDDDISVDYVLELSREDGVRNYGRVQGDPRYRGIGHLSWKFPWRGGSIHVGYPTTIPKCEVEIREAENSFIWEYDWFPSLHEKPLLLVSISGDDMEWSPPHQLSVPLDVPSPSGRYSGHLSVPSILQAASNGDYLILGRQEKTSITVVATRDLRHWDELTVPLPPPTDLHPVLITRPRLEQIVAGPIGWMIRVTVSGEISIYELLPDNIAESINWSSRCTVESSGYQYQFDVFAYQDGKRGIMVCWHDEESNRQEIFLPWEDLEMDEDTFFHYGSNFGNKPYLQSPNFSGWVWPEKWNIDMSSGDGWIELPYVPGKLCCQLLSTDAGYLALTIPMWAGYSPIRSGTQVLFFSPDGRGWSRVETPEETHAKSDWGTPCEESYWFVESIEDFDGKVLAKAENSHNHWNWDWETRGSPPRRSWVIDSDGTNWRLLDAYECEE